MQEIYHEPLSSITVSTGSLSYENTDLSFTDPGNNNVKIFVNKLKDRHQFNYNTTVRANTAFDIVLRRRFFFKSQKFYAWKNIGHYGILNMVAVTCLQTLEDAVWILNDTLRSIH